MRGSVSQPVVGPGPGHSWMEPPGDILVWMIVVVELVTFAAGILVFRFSGKAHPAEFAAGRQALHELPALANTLILLTGGACMALSLGHLRMNRRSAARHWLHGAIASGVFFVLIKCGEYRGLLRAGHGFGDDTYFTLYWMLTAFHLLHVAIAILLLLAMDQGIRTARYSADNPADVEASSVFWHMCDLIWLLVYPSIYLLG